MESSRIKYTLGCMPFTVSCVIRRARPTNSKFHTPSAIPYTLKRDDIPLLSQWIKNNLNCPLRFNLGYFWCGRRDLNPYVGKHTPLKRARLPIPPLPRTTYIIHYFFCFVNRFSQIFSSFFIFTVSKGF